MEVEGNTRAIAARLRELGDADAAERLEAALAGSTSGEIYAYLGVELNRLAREGYRRDPEIGALVTEMRDVVDEINHNPRAWLRRLRRRLRR